MSCPCCGFEGEFIGFGKPKRPRARCPRCKSLERHRAYWVYLQNHLPPGKINVLHVAGEKCLSLMLRDKGYLVTRSGECPQGLELDLQDIQFADDTFDIIVCSHVLEHVPDDRKAMREINRVLKDTGFALIGVPMKAGTTYEDDTIVTKEGRTAAFGQFDHVRYYGQDDFADRMREEGLIVDKVVVLGEWFHICRKGR